MKAFRIRDPKWPDDRPIALALIDGLQAIEHGVIGVLAGNARARAVYEAAGYAPYALPLRKYL